jgi:hypothetical protein
MWHTKLSVSMDIPMTEVTGLPRLGRVVHLALRAPPLAPRPLVPPPGRLALGAGALRRGKVGAPFGVSGI